MNKINLRFFFFFFFFFSFFFFFFFTFTIYQNHALALKMASANFFAFFRIYKHFIYYYYYWETGRSEEGIVNCTWIQVIWTTIKLYQPFLTNNGCLGPSKLSFSSIAETGIIGVRSVYLYLPQIITGNAIVSWMRAVGNLECNLIF